MQNRRNFLKVSSLAGGGLLLGVSWLSGCKEEKMVQKLPEILAEIKKMPNGLSSTVNAYLRINENGAVTILSANPEIGQNIKTSMPMIVAEELDVDWADVTVEQAGLDTENFNRQVAGGSQSIRQGWEGLRRAGATARHLLVAAAAEQWGLDATELKTSKGVITAPDGQTLSYGEVAAKAATMEVPEEVEFKSPAYFSIIGQSQRNVDLENIISGKPLFGLDYGREGMVYAVALRPPSFGHTLKDFDDSDARKVEGVEDVVRFGNKIAVIGRNTWCAMQGQKALKAEWEAGDKTEDTAYHEAELSRHLDMKAEEPRRVDGDVDAALAAADEVFERTYAAPYLPHACLEPMNFFANVTDAGAELVGPIQTPAWTQQRVAALLEIEPEKVSIDMTRMGGGFGRRLYGDFALEAAEISSKIGKPVKLVFSREDDMLAGTYRPASQYKFKVGIKDGDISGWHLTEACFNGQMFDPMPNNYPAGTIADYRIDSHQLESNISTGAWRAPYANFLAYAEQAFMDELAEYLGKDKVQFRLDLFEKARTSPVGENNNYEIDKYVGVIKLAAEKAGFGKPIARNTYQGFSAYFSHNTYVAEVAEVVMDGDTPRVTKVTCAVDCGIVINPDAARNQIEGGIIDGIGHAMYSDFKFTNGRSEAENFHQYRLIRMSEAPEVEIHFVESDNDPTGLGEPSLPPAGGAVANALAAALGQRIYRQPFVEALKMRG
ncbi:isoquinoline 1-oxidoreductase [Lewinellaceae bacterium SD302]|nr:isoquinoline 1-oxidoreductase [Lewinellaceae bacterium SD302]